MKKVIPAVGFVVEGSNRLYETEQEAQRVSVKEARLSLIKSCIGHKIHSDPLGALLDDQELLKRVVELEYKE